MISKETLLDSLGMFKAEFDNRYATSDLYETVTEDDVNELFIEIGTFTYEYTSSSATGTSEFEIGMTWEEYINSEYNTIGCEAWGSVGVAINGFHIIGGSSTEISPPDITDEIIDGYHYYAVLEFE